jgi:hypothetical protein
MLMHFNLLEPGADELVDAEGVDLPDVEAAWKFSLRTARDIMGEELKERGGQCKGWSISVTDQAGTILLVFSFDEALAPGVGLGGYVTQWQ